MRAKCSGAVNMGDGKKEWIKILGKTHCRVCRRRKNGIIPSTGVCRKCTLERNLRRDKKA